MQNYIAPHECSAYLAQIYDQALASAENNNNYDALEGKEARRKEGLRRRRFEGEEGRGGSRRKRLELKEVHSRSLTAISTIDIWNRDYRNEFVQQQRGSKPGMPVTQIHMIS